MRYVVTKRYKKRCIAGEVNLPYGTALEETGGRITHKGRTLCYTTSQDAYDYMARDDDGRGLERGKLVHEIKGLLARKDRRHQDRWDRLWADRTANAMRRKEHEDFWVWGLPFYNADIEDLTHILTIIKEV